MSLPIRNAACRTRAAGLFTAASFWRFALDGYSRSSAARNFRFAVLHDLVQSKAICVGLDLYPDRQVVGDLKAEFVARHFFPREQFFNHGCLRVEVEGAPGCDGVFRQRRQMQDLIVPGVVAEFEPFRTWSPIISAASALVSVSLRCPQLG
jgi:hypothetical protein